MFELYQKIDEDMVKHGGEKNPEILEESGGPNSQSDSNCLKEQIEGEMIYEQTVKLEYEDVCF